MGREGTDDEPAGEVLRLQRRLRVISEVTRRFAEVTTDYGKLLDYVASGLGENIRDACVVFLLDQGGETLSAVAMHAAEAQVLQQFRDSFAERKLVLADQIALRHVLTSGQSVLVPRLAERTEKSAERERWQGLGLHSVLLVPLQVQGRPIGVLTLSRYRPESPPFDDSDLELAQNLADHAGLAIDNARLYAEAAEARLAAERAYQAAHRSEEARRQFLEASPIARYVVDAETLKVLEVNAAALALYGYERDEFLSLDLGALRHPDDQQRLAGILKAAGDDHTTGLARHRRKDGKLIHVEGSSQLSTLHGRPARFVVVSDETKRVQAELERDESEQRLRRTLDNMQEGYTIMSRDLRYLYMNRAGAEQTHLTREQLLGHSPLELYPGFEGSRIHLALARAVETGERQRVEEEFQHADGELGYFDLNIQPVPEGLVVLSIDQTERRRAEKRRDSLEEQLRQAQKMEAVGRLAGGIAHDFNNVLSVILGYAEELAVEMAPSDPHREDVREIHGAAERAAQLTKQLLMFSRQQMVEPKVLDLNVVVASMDRMLGRALGEEVEVAILPGKELGRIRADRGNIEQVIMNLIVNARDAMPSGGRLTIETSNVLVDEAFVREHLGSEPGPYVVLAVTDSGVGMDQATRAHIFEPFFSTKALGKGTGLGLSTVFGIVQRCGGGVWVYSEPGRGTTFKIYLPRVDAEPEALRPTLPPVELSGTETVLLVEDEVPLRLVAKRILERLGYRVLVAESPGEAAPLCESHDGPIQLLLTDVVMPLVSGPELAARLSSLRPGLKVLFMSGYTDGSIDAHGVIERGAAFLQKPFTSELLAHKVRSVLDGHEG
jgi:two-component system, cell cycle sensor histidine kinase and response regulator CckA